MSHITSSIHILTPNHNFPLPNKHLAFLLLTLPNEILLLVLNLLDFRALQTVGALVDDGDTKFDLKRVRPAFSNEALHLAHRLPVLPGFLMFFGLVMND